MSSNDFEELCTQARVAVQDRELERAIDLYWKALAISPEDVGALDGLATAYVLAENYDRAINCFEQITLLKPRDAKAFVNLGALHNLKHNYIAAATVLRKAVQRNSKSADAFYNLGIAEKGQGQLALAISAYRECIKLKPETAEAHVNLANCLIEQKNYKKAIEHYELALRHRPDFPSAKRGVTHAKTLLAQVKDTSAPFGRLVDTEKLDHQLAAAVHTRELNEDERFEDRQFLTLELQDTVETTGKFLMHLKEHFEPALLQINRVLMNSDSIDRGVLLDLSDNFHEAWKFAQSLYERLDDSRLALKEHEYDIQDSPE